ncbi:AAA family ATPase [Amnibacterium kyonggiense]|uniref:Shikimate kinase n=1 Tax=Amnibacterium kyonggiense TaxID=595671 RepID=A0A4R7FEV9_9MICO|nr:AAA family ATPase [Amnibacterium kyonggiense]TDS75903.1 shikimate kinase [Amnibacterium kyonggiense]
MVAVLLTGMSGAGKSTALAALADRGVETVDTDVPGWIEVVHGEPLWREDRVRDLLDRPRDGPLVVSGTVANQGRFRDRFDAVVLLTAPLEVLLDRLEHRMTNLYGRTAAERAAVVRDTREVEPLLRAAATHVIDTTAEPETVVAALVAVLS